MADVSSVYDGTYSFLGGHNEINELNQQRNSYSRGVNVMLDGHSLVPRYGMAETGEAPDELLDLFWGGKVQALVPIPDTLSYLKVVGGRLFQGSLKDGSALLVQIGNNEQDRMSSSLRRINWSYAGSFIVFFDYPRLPVIYRMGQGARRSSLDRIDYVVDPNNPEELIAANTPEIPPSELGAFNEDRLFIAEGFTITAGDSVSVSNPDAPITFTDVLTANAPYVDEFIDIGNSGPYHYITAMGYLKVSQTTTGFGPLLVSTTNDLYSCDSSKPRSQWSSDGGFQKKMLEGVSIAGQRAFANVHNDLLFIDQNAGVRSFGVELEKQKKWDSFSLSRRVGKMMVGDVDLYRFSVVEYWDNKAFFLVAPILGESKNEVGQPVADTFYRGILVLDFGPNSDFSEDSSPVFLGVWTGALFSEMMVLDGALYVQGRVGERNVLFKVCKERRFDTYRGKVKNIKSRVYFDRFGFATRFNDKELKAISTDFKGIENDFSFGCYYRPNGVSDYSLYKKFSYRVNTCRDFGEPATASHSLDQIKLGRPEVVSCNEATESIVTRFRELDLRFDLSGVWEFKSLTLRAETKIDTSDSNIGGFPEEGKSVLLNCSNESDWNFYSINDGANDVGF